MPPTDDQIAALASAMNTMLDRIEAESAAQRRFVADASHELRSPLATIHANAGLLRSAALPKASVRPVERIHEGGGRMARPVDDLLLLARLDDQAVRLRTGDVDVDDLVYAERDRVGVEHPALRIEGPSNRCVSTASGPAAPSAAQPGRHRDAARPAQRHDRSRRDR